MWLEKPNSQEERLLIPAISDPLQRFNGELRDFAIGIANIGNHGVFRCHAFLSIAATLLQCIVSPTLAAEYCRD